ncbi:tetrapyrrole-binding protein, chloroplastic [Oryza brachyantha]|uniref:GUN4-like domain-containing protein n=1 Tax=Oryza brachyantha TaxID=4533 RepID=J3N7E6_ORYBR|nr:tetrapyrrole-binding protein, chloroplastic [Oryza brachyantha]
MHTHTPLQSHHQQNVHKPLTASGQVNNPLPQLNPIHFFIILSLPFLPSFPFPGAAWLLPSSLSSSAMANASLRSFLLHHHHSFLSSSHEGSSPPVVLRLTANTNTSTSTSISFKLFSNTTSSSSVTTASSPNSSAPTPATPTTPPPPSLELLGSQLAGRDYRGADETTRALLIELAGEPARRRGYVFFSEVQFISTEDLRAIDALWREHSGGKFGYSVQRRLWEKSRRDFTRFFIRVGWMKKLDTEVEQFNYRAFPDEFVWELSDDTPEGHLPLTNALRGTQLLGNILTHPAFGEGQEEEAELESETPAATGQSKDDNKGKERPKFMRDFKPDYSF